MRVAADVRFAIVPEWIVYGRISAQAVRLYAVLARKANQDGAARVGQGWIAHQMHCSTDTVARALGELEDFGAVTVTRHKKKPGEPIPPNDYLLHQGSRTGAVTPTSTDAVTGTRTGAVQVQKEEPERTTSVAPLRKPDPIFETLAAIEGSDLADLTRSQRGALNKAAKELRDLHVTPDAIVVRAKAFGRRYPGATLTALALVRHWAELNGRGVDTRPDWQVWEEALGE